MSKVWQVESSASRTKLTTKLKISTNLERLKISEFFVLYLSAPGAADIRDRVPHLDIFNLPAVPRNPGTCIEFSKPPK